MEKRRCPGLLEAGDVSRLAEAVLQRSANMIYRLTALLLKGCNESEQLSEWNLRLPK